MSTDDSDKMLDQLIQNCHHLKQQLAEKSRLVESKKIDDNRRRILRILQQRCLEKFRKEVDTLRKQDSALESCSSFLNSHICEIESNLIDTDEQILSSKFMPASRDRDSRIDILLADKYRYVAQLHKECQKVERQIVELEANFQKSKQVYVEKICSAALIVSDDFKSDIGDWIDAKFEYEKNRLKMKFIDQMKDDLKTDKDIVNQNYAKLRYKMYDVDRITNAMRSKHAQIVTDLTAAKNGVVSIKNQIDNVRGKIKVCQEMNDQTKLRLLSVKNFDKISTKQYSTGSICSLLINWDISDVESLWHQKSNREMSAILWRYSSIPPIRLCLETQSIAARFPPNFDSILNFVSQIRGVSFDDAKVEIDQYANIVEQLEKFSIDNSQETLDNLENLLKELRNRYATAKCIKIFLKTD